MPGDWQLSWMKGTTSSATYASYTDCTYERWRGCAPLSYQLWLLTELTQKSLTLPPSTWWPSASIMPWPSNSRSSPPLVGNTSMGGPQWP